MTPGKHVEYRVREIKRYTVTRHEMHIDEQGREACGSSTQVGSHYDNYDAAFAVAYALCAKEHGDLGYDLGDERIQYPREPESDRAVQAPTPPPPQTP